MTVGDVAIGNGNVVGNHSGGSNAQASARAGARLASLPVTESDVESDARIRRVAGSVGAVGRRVIDDCRDAWPWRGQAPSVLDHLAAKPERHRVAGGAAWLFVPWVAYHYGVALPVIAALSTVMWLVQHPLRALPALTVLLLLAAMWF